jgi:putative ABC transport system permease protein
MLTDAHVRRGLRPADARVAALRQFGGITQMTEEYRDQRSLPWLEMFLRDARYAIRSLRRTPGFTAATLLTLALGIGATTAVFSVVNSVLLRPLPYPDADRIVQFGRTFHTSANVQYGHTGQRYMFSRDHLTTVEGLAAYHPVGFNLATGDGAEYVLGHAASVEYFDVFGVRPLHGQPFTAEHDREGGPDVAIISYGLWQRLFGATLRPLAERFGSPNSPIPSSASCRASSSR